MIFTLSKVNPNIKVIGDTTINLNSGFTILYGETNTFKTTLLKTFNIINSFEFTTYNIPAKLYKPFVKDLIKKRSLTINLNNLFEDVFFVETVNYAIVKFVRNELLNEHDEFFLKNYVFDCCIQLDDILLSRFYDLLQHNELFIHKLFDLSESDVLNGLIVIKLKADVDLGYYNDNLIRGCSEAILELLTYLLIPKCYYEVSGRSMLNSIDYLINNIIVTKGNKEYADYLLNLKNNPIYKSSQNSIVIQGFLANQLEDGIIKGCFMEHDRYGYALAIKGNKNLKKKTDITFIRSENLSGSVKSILRLYLHLRKGTLQEHSTILIDNVDECLSNKQLECLCVVLYELHSKLSINFIITTNNKLFIDVIKNYNKLFNVNKHFVDFKVLQNEAKSLTIQTININEYVTTINTDKTSFEGIIAENFKKSSVMC